MHRRIVSLEELEHLLVQLGSELDFPTADLAPGVVKRFVVETSSPSVAWFDRRRTGRLLLVAALVATFLAGVAFAGWLGLRGVGITTGRPDASLAPAGDRLKLGQRVSLSTARSQMGFRVRLPHDSLGRPDEVYMRSLGLGTQVFLVYEARRGIPAAPQTGVGLLISEFEAPIDVEWLHKYLDNGPLEPVDVADGRAFWIRSGHGVAYLDEAGRPLDDEVRLAGNVLLWEDGPVTLRLEGAIGKDAALRIGRSFG